MIFGWRLKKHGPSNEIKYKKTTRKELWHEWVKYGEDMTNANKLDEP